MLATLRVVGRLEDASTAVAIGPTAKASPREGLGGEGAARGPLVWGGERNELRGRRPERSQGLVEPGDGYGGAASVVGEAEVNVGVIVGVGNVFAAGSLSRVAEQYGEGGEAFGGAARGARGPIFGAVDWGEPVEVPSVGVRAGGEEGYGDGGEPGAGGEVEGGAAAAVSVEYGLGVRDEGAPHGGEGSLSDGDLEACRWRRRGRRRAVFGRGRGQRRGARAAG